MKVFLEGAQNSMEDKLLIGRGSQIFIWAEICSQNNMGHVFIYESGSQTFLVEPPLGDTYFNI